MSSAVSSALRDSRTMLRRYLIHTRRNPTVIFGALVFPIILLLMFVYVIGGQVDRGSGEYLAYVVPGGLVLGLGYGVAMTATAVSYDMTKGIIDRFRMMAISRAAVLTGHVVGTTLVSVFCTAAILGLTLLLGFRPNATPVEWLAVIGLVTLVLLALSWLTVAFGLAAPSPDAAGFYSFPVIFLPFTSSAFAPVDTMPAGLSWFAENQPFTPIIETMRGLMTGSPIGSSGWLAVVWTVGIGLVGYLWSRRTFNRR
jgi:ABC-2 type transport system permease protein